MKQKSIIYLVLILVAAAGIGIWMLTKAPEPATDVLLSPPATSIPRAKDVIVGYGWSVKSDVVEAVREAVATALEKFGGAAPEYAVLFSTVGYDLELLSQEVRTLLPNTKLQGGTSMLGVYTTDGYHVGEIGSLAIMLVSSPKIVFGVAGADVDVVGTSREAGRQAILAAIADAGKTVEEPPKLVYMLGSFNNEEGILAGIEEVIGNEIPVVGGSAFDDDATGKWKQFYNDDIYTNGVVLAAFYTDLKIGWAYEAGYDKTGKKGFITKAAERTIYEIDGRPALDVYDGWTGGLVSDLTKDVKEDIFVNIEQTALNPIAKIMSGKHSEIHYLTMHPYLWNLKERSVTLGVAVKPGDEVTLMHGTWETNLNHSQTTPAKALASQDIKKGEGYFAIYSYCLGKMLTIPAEERVKIPLVVNQTLGYIPFVGGNTGGEQGLLEGVGNEHGGLVNDIIIFGPVE